MTSLLEDLRWGLRILRRSPGLTVTAVATLAVGIAANTIVFNWIDGVLIDPIPGASRGSELVSLETVSPSGDLQSTSYRNYRDFRDGLRQVSGLAASLPNVFTAGAADDPHLLWGEFVSANYFSVLGVQPVRGRAFLPGESIDSPGGQPVVVISDRLWQSVFGRDPSVVGRTLRVNQHPLTVVGVLPPAFRGAVPGLAMEMWVPVSLAPELNGQGSWLLEQRDDRNMWVTARLRPGVAVEQARAEVEAIARRIAEADPATSRAFSATILPIWRGHLGLQHALRTPLRILMSACLLLFLIVAANVASLQLARSAARQKEFSIRLAMGARPTRLVRLLLTESMLLSAAGGLGGVLLTMWGRPALLWLLPPHNLPVEVDAGSNWHTLAFLIVLCAAATVLTGLTPAFHCLRTRVNDHLKDSSRGSTSGPAGHRTRSLLVVSEVALATVAIVGTGALVRVFRDTRALDPGMDAANVACAKYYVATFCRTTEERRQFCLRLARRLRETPGVTAVGYANRIPLEYGDAIQTSIAVEGYAPAIGEDMRVRNHSVSPGYFNALGIPVLEGRDFTEQDKAGAPRALVVNQAFVRRFLGGGPVVGRRVRGEDGGPWFTVVGVVRDSRYYRLTEPREPYFYTASSQTSGGEFWMAFFVRTAGPIDPALPALGREAALVHAGTRGSSFLPYRLWLDSALYPQRVAATLVGVVGVISLLLSAIGLYSVLAFAVSRRINEFGIRIALGARRRHVLGDVLRQGAVLTVAGIGAGSVLALLALRLSASLLPELRTGDPVTLASSVLLLGLVGCLASYLPARRATRVDPLQALRHD